MLSELSTVSTYPTVTTVSDYLLSLSLFIFFRGDERRAVVNENSFYLIMHTEKFARESLPCVRGGAEHSEAEGLLETEKSAAKL